MRSSLRALGGAPAARRDEGPHADRADRHHLTRRVVLASSPIRNMSDLAYTSDSDKDIFGPMESHMDQMAALSHLRTLIRAAKGKNDVEALHQALQEMLLFVEKSLGRKG
jgi:hypothetical protein